MSSPTAEKSFPGANSSSADEVASYEEAGVNIGAPVESISPLGYHVGAISVTFLNVGRMIGTGVYSTPGAILQGVGSVGLSLFFWVLGYAFAAATLAVYMEYATYFPHRSGGEVAYLEKAFPKPPFLLPMAFAVTTVLLSFSVGASIVLAQYLLVAAGNTTTTWHVRGVAVGAFTAIMIVCIISTKWSLRISNFLGVLKVLTLLFISITGLVVLSGRTRVQDPHANFRHAFSESDSNGNGLATALAKVNFAYTGFANSFNVVNEVRNPVKTMKVYSSFSLSLVFVLYMFVNIAFFAAVPKDVIRHSKQLTASLFFSAVFGGSKANRALDVLIVISAVGSIFTIIIGGSRMIRECGRQGVLPFPKFWASTKPFNTPLGPFLIDWLLTIVMILSLPSGDAFNFVVDLQTYPSSVFNCLMVVGLLFVRRRRQEINAPPSGFRTWNFLLVFALLVNLYVFVLPWVPPRGGVNGGDVSFFYATYCIVGLGMIFLCGVAYYIWMHLLPKMGGYSLRQVTETLSDGAQTNRMVKVPNSELVEWDAAHDMAAT